MRGFLPTFAQAWVRSVFIERLLPEQVVVKIQKQCDDRNEEEFIANLFDTEAKVQDQLKPLQGVVVPRCYGQLRYNGSKPLMLEHLGGVSLLSTEGCSNATKRFMALACTTTTPIWEAFSSFTAGLWCWTLRDPGCIVLHLREITLRAQISGT
jgi:hypothetical protein